MLTVNSPPTCPITISTAPPHYPLSLHSRASPLHHLPAHNILTHPSSAADSFETQIEKLKKKLKHAENELDEAQRIAATQDEHVRSLEGDHEERKKEFEAREASLQQDKKDLEEHMVSVVVQQVREAKAKERNTVRDECEAEFNEKMADVNKEAEELRAKVADLLQGRG
jgi:chromosome segregation ATPase